MSSPTQVVFRTELPANAEEAFAWHTRPGALERLTPPWQRLEVVSRHGTIREGDRAVMRVGVGPFSRRWVAVHKGYEEGREFSDEQEQGPFASWHHNHRVLPVDERRSVLEDRLTYALPLGVLGRAVGGAYARHTLARTFAYRHAVLAGDLAQHAVAGGRRFRIAVSGSSGFLGGALVPFLTSGGHEVVRLVRSRPRPDSTDVYWDPTTGEVDAARLEGIDAVVHLAGENIAAGRWTAWRKERILHSRSEGTRLLAEALARLATPPKVIVSASAVGIYAERGDEPVDEYGASGNDFLAQVVRAWEAAVAPAQQRGIRVAMPRLGMILSPRGGALAKLLPAFRAGAGGRLGDGRQWVSWISLDDALGAIHHALFTDELRGAYNAVAPEPVHQADFARTLGHAVHRPALLAMPSSAIKMIFGEMGEAALLRGPRVVPKRLPAAGFRFRHERLEDALDYLLGRREAQAEVVVGVEGAVGAGVPG